MPLTVLLIAGGGLQGESLAEAIRNLAAARIIVADTIADNLGRNFADRYLVCPPVHDKEAFGAFLEATAVDEQVDLILPCSQIGLLELASMRKRIERGGTVLAVSEPALLRLLLDKKLTYEALLDAGIPAQEPVALSRSATLPLCGKPNGGWGGLGLLVIRTPEELARLDLQACALTHCWVPWLPAFDEYSADFAIDRHGRSSPLTIRRRVRVSGGFAVISDSVFEKGIHDLVSRVSSWLAGRGGFGLFNVQMLKLPDGTLYVSDINPRHGTSSGHAAAEGNPLVGFLTGAPAAGSRRPVRTIRSLRSKVLPLPGVNCWKGVVFDLDDTLIDQKRWIMLKMEGAAAALSNLIDRDRLLRVAYGLVEEGMHERLIDLLAERLNMPSMHPDLLENYRAAEPVEAPVYPDVEYAIASLRSAGLRIGLLADNPPSSQRAKLAKMRRVEALFDATVFTREYGGEKPDLAGFFEVARQLELAPHELLMVGDNVARDAVGAISAGYDACLLVHRAGTRHGVNSGLLARYQPEVHDRTWFAEDLRGLAVACGTVS